MNAPEESQVVVRNGTVVTTPDPPTVVPEVIPNPNGMGDIIVIRDGYNVHSLRGPEEGFPVHEFHDLESMADYLNRHHVAASETVEIIVQDFSVVAYIDSSKTDPQVIRCALQTHPAWRAWGNAIRSNYDQRAMQQFIRAWRSTIQDADVLMAKFSAIQVTGSQTMQSHIDETGSTRVSSNEGKTDIAVKIPPVLYAKVPVYVNVRVGDADKNEEATYDLEVLVSIDTHPCIEVTLSCPTMDIQLNKARRDVAKWLTVLLDDGFLVGIGTGGHDVRKISGASYRGE